METNYTKEIYWFVTQRGVQEATAKEFIQAMLEPYYLQRRLDEMEAAHQRDKEAAK